MEYAVGLKFAEMTVGGFTSWSSDLQRDRGKELRLLFFFFFFEFGSSISLHVWCQRGESIDHLLIERRERARLARRVMICGAACGLAVLTYSRANMPR